MWSVCKRIRVGKIMSVRLHILTTTLERHDCYLIWIDKIPTDIGQQTYIVVIQLPWVGFSKQISSVSLFSRFFTIVKTLVAYCIHVYHCLMSPQLNCGDIRQIWKWFKEPNRHFYKLKYFLYGEINERNFSDPNPGSGFNNKMPSYQYRKSHRGNKTILRPSYLHNGISYTVSRYLYIESVPWCGIGSRQLATTMSTQTDDSRWVGSYYHTYNAQWDW